MSLGDLLEDAASSVVGKALLGAALPFWGGTLIEYLGGTNSVLGRSVEVSLSVTPGLAQGESFTQAFVSAYALRLRLVADYYSVGTADEIINEAYQKIASDPTFQATVVAIVGDRVGEAATQGLTSAGFDPEQLSSYYKVRPDVAAMAINAAAHQPIYNLGDFDVPSGKRGLLKPIGAKGDAARALAALNQATRAGAPTDRLQALRQAYVNALVHDMAPRPPRTLATVLEDWRKAITLLGPTSAITKAYEAEYERAVIAKRADPHADAEVTFATSATSPDGRPRSSLGRDLLSFGVLTSPAWLLLILTKVRR